MISLMDARGIAAAHIGEGRPRTAGFTPHLIDEETMETPWGWVFFYQSAEYLRSQELSEALVGNGPIAVAKRDGRVYEMGTAETVEEAIERIAAEEVRRS